MTSITSSTVTKPITLPSFSSTGTASRLYFAIFAATASWSSSAFTVTGLRSLTLSARRAAEGVPRAGLGAHPLPARLRQRGHHQVAQRPRAEQLARLRLQH